MAGVALLLVVLSGFLHATWNLFTKQSMNKFSFLWQVNMVGLLIFLPFLVAEWQQFYHFGVQGWLVVSAAAIIHGVYFYAMAKAYSIGDLSHIYPMMRGTASFFVPILAVFLFGESLALGGWIGIIAIVIGIFTLSNWLGSRVHKTAFAYALFVSVCITSYVLVDKMALAYLSPLALTGMHCIGVCGVLSYRVLRSGYIQREWRANYTVIILGGILVPGSYLLFLIAMTIEQVAQLAPVREISIVFGTLYGIFLLKEKQGLRRIAATLIILLGIISVGYQG